MRKREFYISITVFIFLTIYYGTGMMKVRTISTKSDFMFVIPRIKPIVVSMPRLNNVGNLRVWNVKPPYNMKGGGVPPTSPKELRKSVISFALKKINGIPSLINIYNQKYRWEFFGTVKTEAGERAVFFNPALKDGGLRLLKAGMKLDKGLILKHIGNDNVTVMYTADNRTKDFVISIFNVNIKKIQREVGAK